MQRAAHCSPDHVNPCVIHPQHAAGMNCRRAFSSFINNNGSEEMEHAADWNVKGKWLNQLWGPINFQQVAAAICRRLYDLVECQGFYMYRAVWWGCLFLVILWILWSRRPRITKFTGVLLENCAAFMCNFAPYCGKNRMKCLQFSADFAFCAWKSLLCVTRIKNQSKDASYTSGLTESSI